MFFQVIKLPNLLSDATLSVIYPTRHVTVGSGTLAFYPACNQALPHLRSHSSPPLVSVRGDFYKGAIRPLSPPRLQETLSGAQSYAGTRSPGGLAYSFSEPHPVSYCCATRTSSNTK